MRRCCDDLEDIDGVAARPVDLIRLEMILSVAELFERLSQTSGYRAEQQLLDLVGIKALERRLAPQRLQELELVREELVAQFTRTNREGPQLDFLVRMHAGPQACAQHQLHSKRPLFYINKFACFVFVFLF